MTPGGIMAAASLQHHNFSPGLLLSTAPTAATSSPSSSSLCSTPQCASPCAQYVSPSVGWVSRSPCVMQRFPVGYWTPAVSGVRVASRGGASVVEEEDADEEEEDEEEDGLSLYEEQLGLEDEEGIGAELNEEEENVATGGAKVRRTFRPLGNKEKKELRAYAHQLGNDICIHQVGKWGLTANCITAISDALEANELVKIRVLDNLDEELGDTAKQLERKTGAQIVGKMGRTLLLYRPSMRKLKAAQAAEEKAYKYQRRTNLNSASRTKSSKRFPGASRGRR